MITEQEYTQLFRLRKEYYKWVSANPLSNPNIYFGKHALKPLEGCYLKRIISKADADVYHNFGCELCPLQGRFPLDECAHTNSIINSYIKGYNIVALSDYYKGMSKQKVIAYRDFCELIEIAGRTVNDEQRKVL